jgi:hypothetical protein
MSAPSEGFDFVVEAFEKAAGLAADEVVRDLTRQFSKVVKRLSKRLRPLSLTLFTQPLNVLSLRGIGCGDG